jgi:hypothetical protein
VRIFNTVITLILVLLFSGCIKAAPARSTKMFTFVYSEKLAHLKESIRLVRIAGGEETIPFSKVPKVSNTELQQAMNKSLEISKLLGGKNAKYKLSFRLVEDSALHFSGSSVVSTNMQYQLKDAFDNRIVYDKNFSVYHVVKLRKGFFYPDRHRKGLENSVQKNIKMFIEDLENVTLGQTPE